MQDYDGNEMTIRVTHKGGYQVIPVPCTPYDMSRAPVFDTEALAIAYIQRPIPEWLKLERVKDRERKQYREKYAELLSLPEMRAMREEIQEAYQTAIYRSRIQGDQQRAAVRGAGTVSCMGRNLGDVRQAYADQLASEIDMDWDVYDDRFHKYEIAIQAAMTREGIPVSLFRGPVLVDNAIQPQTRS